MSERERTLARRRSALRAHCAIQRNHLAGTATEIDTRLLNVDRSVDIVRRYAGHPLLISGAMAVLALVGPRRMIRWAASSAVLLTTGQRVLRLLRK